MASAKPSIAGAAPAGRRPNPQLAQFKRTFYFLSRNTLAMIGLAIVFLFVFVAVWGVFYSAPNAALVSYCGTTSSNGQQNFSSVAATCPGVTLCTYPITSAPIANCYPVYQQAPSQIAPTWDLAHFSAGPLPFGSLTVTPGLPYFYNPFEGLIKGAQWSLGIAAGIVLAGSFIGIVFGCVSGYFGGVVDEVMMRLTDIFLSIPGFLLVLVIIATIGYTIQSLDGKILVMMGAFILTWWPGYTRIVRGQVLVTREQKYIEASKASGARPGRIIWRHILPNSLYPVFVQVSLDVGSIPLALGGIAFLGFHIWPTQYFPEWGTIAALATNDLSEQLLVCTGGTCVFPWWQILFPGLTLFLFAISVSFLSDGLRDALDPRLRR